MGKITVANTHPFTYGRWTFAHNGTLSGFRSFQKELRAVLPADLRRCIRGETDSEHCFYYILSRIREAQGDLSGPCRPALICQILGRTILDLDGRCQFQSEPSQFNFVLTDGQLLVASRWGRSLFWIERRVAEAAPGGGASSNSLKYHAVAIASEPTSEERWSPLPEKSIICVNRRLAATILPFA
jgi:glutamine amidotransferase